MTTKDHWQQVYAEKSSVEVSWFQAHAVRSLALIDAAALPPSTAIIDVGGGASTLVDDLLNRGYGDLTVLDLSAAALRVARQRLGAHAADIQWLEGDVRHLRLPEARYDLWHDRAAFHFLVTPGDRARYVAAVRSSLKPGGHLVIATFADDGPERCSGLPVQRYSEASLAAAFGEDFIAQSQARERHRTPAGNPQNFVYCHLRYRAE
jgi:ubiquinone/menaquinone biosynthesis C-methylase UbiE